MERRLSWGRSDQELPEFWHHPGAKGGQDANQRVEKVS